MDPQLEFLLPHSFPFKNTCVTSLGFSVNDDDVFSDVTFDLPPAAIDDISLDSFDHFDFDLDINNNNVTSQILADVINDARRDDVNILPTSHLQAPSSGTSEIKTAVRQASRAKRQTKGTVTSATADEQAARAPKTKKSTTKKSRKIRDTKKKPKARKCRASTADDVEATQAATCSQAASSPASTSSYDSGIASGDDVSVTSSTCAQEQQVRDNDDVVASSCSSDQRSNHKRRRKAAGAQPSDAEKEYNLRMTSLINRVEVQRRNETPKEKKPKTRPPPLSKYRRKTANARERTRMCEINEGFEELKKVIPDLPEGKLTKITTLRLALDYMHSLRRLLGYEDEDGNEIAQAPASDVTPNDQTTSCGGET